jgi:hypothetical protein
MFERRLYYHIDWALVAAIFLLCGLGVAMIYSTTSDPTRAASHLWATQLYAMGLGVIDADHAVTTIALHGQVPLIYIALIGAVYVMLFGTVQMGARRWIPPVLQPAAVGVRQDRRCAVLAKFYGENRGAPQWTDPDRRRAHAASRGAHLQGARSRMAVVLLPVSSPSRISPVQPARARHRLPALARGAGRVMSCSGRTKARAQVDPRRMRRALIPADPGAHHGGSYGLTGRASEGTQVSCGFSPSPTTTSSSVLAEEQGLLASSWRSALLFVIPRALEAARLAKDRPGSYLVLACSPASASR